MDERVTKEETVEIDLGRLAATLWKKAWRIALAAFLCAAVVLLGTALFITPKYRSSVMFHVNNSVLAQGETAHSIDSADISASRNLVESCLVLLKTGESLEAVIDHTGVARSDTELAEMISAKAVGSTEIIQIVVTSPDPVEAERIASAVAEILPGRISNILEGASVKVVDTARMPSKPSSPSYLGNALIGFVAGLFLTAAIVALREIFDTSIRREEDVVRVCACPVLASVPETGIAASEAYKILRTKLEVSFEDSGGCRVIGVTGAVPGKEKRVTAGNLAYALSQKNRKVLLIDCDLRRAASARKQPGLSDCLTGKSPLREIIQPSVSGRGFQVIASGQSSVDPMELLSSAAMAKLIECLRQVYDDIILDLPPVGEVGDALTAARVTDGIILEIRQGSCSRDTLQSAVGQLEYMGARILGVVLILLLNRNP